VLTKGHWAADVIYTPLRTEFLNAAASMGARTLNSSGMCVHQAVEAFRQLTGVTPDFGVLQRTFATAVAERDAALSDELTSTQRINISMTKSSIAAACLSGSVLGRD
jgi:shikimate dehydrogenase